MDNKRQVGSCCSLFGEKESPPSSGTFASIFPPSQTVHGKKMSSDLTGVPPKQFPGNTAWNGQQAANLSGGASGNKPTKDSSTFGEPCHLSSSLYYGGRDVYPQTPSTQNAGSYAIFKKEGEKDDPDGANSDSASRGNWWQGSLYY